MSETPKKKAATKKAVNEHASAYDNKATKTGNPAPKKAVPAKPARKTTTAKPAEATAKAVEPTVTNAGVDSVLTKAPGFWARVKQFFLGA